MLSQYQPTGRKHCFRTLSTLDSLKFYSYIHSRTIHISSKDKKTEIFSKGALTLGTRCAVCHIHQPGGVGVSTRWAIGWLGRLLRAVVTYWTLVGIRVLHGGCCLGSSPAVVTSPAGQVGVNGGSRAVISSQAGEALGLGPQPSVVVVCATRTWILCGHLGAIQTVIT